MARPPPLAPPHKGEGNQMRRIESFHDSLATPFPFWGGRRAEGERGGGREVSAECSSLRGAQRRSFARNDERETYACRFSRSVTLLGLRIVICPCLAVDSRAVWSCRVTWRVVAG